MDERVRVAGDLYERAIFQGEFDGLAIADRELDAVEAELAIARGKVLHGRFLETHAEDPRELELFERALALYQSVDERGQAEAHFWIGCFHQVVRADTEPAVAALTRSRELAEQTGDQLVLSYALRHLGIAAHLAGDLVEARSLLEQSTALRRTLGFTANLVGLIYLSTGAEAQALAEEATALAGAAGVTTIITQIQEARARL